MIRLVYVGESCYQELEILTSGNLIRELRSALAHLYNLAYLENHPLAMRIHPEGSPAELSRGRLLRRALKLGIEALDPGPGFAPNSPEGRPYQVLHNRYIARQSIVQIAEQLGISERQAYRELQFALEALAEIFCRTAKGSDQAPTQEAFASTMADVEVERLSATDKQVVNLEQLVSQAVDPIRRLARGRGVQILYTVRASGLQVAVNRVMLRQAILNLLSHFVGLQGEHTLDVCLDRAGEWALLRISSQPGRLPHAPEPGQPYAIAMELFSSLSFELTAEEQGDTSAQVIVRIPLLQQRRVLIIDDQQGLIRLFERYLEGQPYQVYGATDSNEALALVEHLQPDIIILDVMMPQRDGWEVLEALRRSEAGQRARVVVCSIINDPQLSAALGADAFLHKPVDQPHLLRTLNGLHSLAA